ncbi:hypothetical protein GU243_01295 [Pseudarthrobacter psychrotolerans]|uniref:Uncharacterized protein n=1 Tax=Pseudarthrobacter psychrotolerans TaxID=2697569 RepID=A0A6P1NED4_9MICC|nr:hypothetical protein [Pseudarthrobacter psychrotolerans]QHK18636.1 hypothetical protein GU243_01295 [Pseudarthrobacter psychrotolerans]
MRLPLMRPPETVERGTFWWVRTALGALGVAALGYAFFGFLANVPLAQLIGVAAWLAAALVVHDGVLVPMTTLAGGGLSRLTYRLRPVQQGIVRGALLIGAMVTLLAAPLIRAQQVLQPSGPESGANVTVLRGDYVQALGVFWLVLAVAAAVAIAGVGRYARRSSVRKTRP